MSRRIPGILFVALLVAVAGVSDAREAPGPKPADGPVKNHRAGSSSSPRSATGGSGPIALSYTVTYEADVDRSLMSDYGDMVERASALLWETSEGQAYLADITIEDRRTDGDVIVPRDVTHRSRTGPGGTYAYVRWTRNGAYMVTGGRRVHPVIFNHEIGHLAFRARDEYRAGYGIDPCIMALGARDQYCDRTNHRARGFRPCWEGHVLPHSRRAHGKSLQHPNSFSGPVPATDIRIVDN